MIPTNPYILGLLLAIALAYTTAHAVKEPIHKAARRVCHVVTLGHKCPAPPPATK